MSQSTIIIADDHPLFRAALVHSLASALPGAKITEVASLKALERAVGEQPEVDLVLLDLHMPGARGFSSLMWLRSEHPAVPVAIISSNEHPQTVHRARQFGALAFIPKSSPVAVLHQALQTIMAGDRWFPDVGDEAAADDIETVRKLASLTPQQLRVLMCVADGLLNKQIAHEMDLSENTVKVHVTAILKKLGVARRTGAAILVRALNDEPGALGNGGGNGGMGNGPLTQ